MKITPRASGVAMISPFHQVRLPQRPDQECHGGYAVLLLIIAHRPAE
jgi:hypothetical protein